MSTNTFRVGSVIKKEDVVFLVIGIRFEEDNNRIVKEYEVVPFPKGFSDSESVRIISADNIELLQDGYSTHLSDSFINYADMIDQIADDADAATVNQIFDSILKTTEV